MLSLKKSSRMANIVIDDYVVRIVENKGSTLDSVQMLAERPLEPGLIENGKIVDEIGFYEFMKTLVKECGLKSCDCRFNVPNSLVIMRRVEFPAELEGEAVKDHFLMEVGNTIHLPFERPVLDVHIHEEFVEGDKQVGTLFAASEEEVIKYATTLEDCGLRPVAADVQPLGVYRYFLQSDRLNPSRVSLFFELNLTGTNLSIFHENRIEFMRFQQIDIRMEDWTYDTKYTKWINWSYQSDETNLIGMMEDQISELDRVMNFYRFSQHGGSKQVEEIIITGDSPDLHTFVRKIENRFDLPVVHLEKIMTEADEEPVGASFIPALGLALKGGVFNA
ncbi:pilus assembly protein PilM [Aciduricibacillus chroicocephali]|uniref:Pilus assembly protein PilM n=1 Tax=Aciduricibacillus chroicocephali TaxID=3054939 RepID=A0ABY9KTM9_9BACI|nr:pilus assembly protein PilM [Bacillaceae bacterium 44XB]